MKLIDINCDLGEGSTIEDCQQDALLMPYISRCNIACGGHAGNTLTMTETLKQAKYHGVIAGAHPGYPDLTNFGRVSMSLPVNELIESIQVQIEQLLSIALSMACPIQHIKLHGALYNDAEKSPELATALCRLIASQYPNLTLVGLADGAMQKAAANTPLHFLKEGFMDRAYLSTGHLAPRTLPGSVYDYPQQAIDQVLCMLKGEKIRSLTTQVLPSQLITLDVDTICLHGDSTLALPLAQSLKQQLLQEGFAIAQHH